MMFRIVRLVAVLIFRGKVHSTVTDLELRNLKDSTTSSACSIKPTCETCWTDRKIDVAFRHTASNCEFVFDMKAANKRGMF